VYYTYNCSILEIHFVLSKIDIIPSQVSSLYYNMSQRKILGQGCWSADADNACKDAMLVRCKKFSASIVRAQDEGIILDHQTPSVLLVSCCDDVGLVSIDRNSAMHC
jgi:hypothetical protein